MKNALLLSHDDWHFAFGLEWFPLIGVLGNAQARRLAARYRATHFVLASDTAGSIGLASLQRGGQSRKRAHVYSAAQRVATKYATGTTALVLRLTQYQWWFVAVHEGAVVARTDILANVPAAFETALADLKRAYPELVYEERDDSESLFAFLNGGGQTAGASLLHSRYWVKPAFKVGPVLRTSVVLLLVGAVGLGVKTWFFSPSERPAVDPDMRRTRWMDAIQASVSQVYLHGVNGTYALLEALYQVPVRPAGWQLERVECLPGSVQWQCSAHYSRQDKATDNEALLSALPSRWALSVVSLNKVNAVWQASMPHEPLSRSRLNDHRENQKSWLAVLQRSSMAFEKIIWGDSAALSVKTPYDDQGRAIVRPNGLPVYQFRSLRITGPLRSYSLLLADFKTIRWTRVVLAVRKTAAPGMRQSQLHLSLEGAFYERG